MQSRWIKLTPQGAGRPLAPEGFLTHCLGKVYPRKLGNPIRPQEGGAGLESQPPAWGGPMGRGTHRLPACDRTCAIA